MEGLIYVPNIENYKCFVIRDSETIRAYKEIPTYNATINYDDIYVNSHYMWQSGSQQFSQYSTIPTCISSDRLTSSVEYRNDFNDILIIFSILVLFIIVIPTSIIFKFVRRGK